MPNMDELLNQISAELSKNDTDPIWISVVDLDYAYGQMKLAPETSKHCNFAITGEKITEYYRFRIGFYGPADIPTIFQEKIDRTLGHETPVWLDDVIVVTRGTKKTHPKIRISTHKTRKRRLQGEQENVKILLKRQSGWQTLLPRME